MPSPLSQATRVWLTLSVCQEDPLTLEFRDETILDIPYYL